MIEKDLAIARELKRKVSEVVELLDFRVFGSRARDEFDEYSDMDVFVEVPFLNKEIRERIYDVTWEVGYMNFMVISTLVFTRDEIENSPLRVSPIVRNIVEEGIQL